MDRRREIRNFLKKEFDNNAPALHFHRDHPPSSQQIILKSNNNWSLTSGFEDTLLVISITMAHIRLTYINESFDPKFAILLKFLSQFPALTDGQPSNLPVAILESQDNSFASMQLHTL